MKLHLLALLACPACGGDLAFVSLDKYPSEKEEIESGTLACRSCAREFPILDSIPRLSADGRMDRRMRKTASSFAWEWLRYPGSLPEDREIFLEETQIPNADWKGRLALDAGCGMGRYARAASGLGAEVVAFDLSESLQRLLPEARANPRLHLAQGDLLHPPFKPGVFDIVYSQGVIHHTPDARRAFERIAPLVKRGGVLSVWVYGSPGSYRSFSTNPLRDGRAWLKNLLPAAWLLVWLRRLVSDAVRLFTARMPAALLYVLCYPLATLGAVPIFRYLTFSVHPRFRVRLIENFDWLAPPFQSKHTKEEMRGWFAAAGLEVLRQLPHGLVPKVGFLGKKP